MNVRRGDQLRLRAADFSAIQAATRRVQEAPTEIGGGRSRLLATSPTRALARNTGDDDIQRYGAVICSAPVIAPSVNEDEWGLRLALDCSIPATDDPFAWIAIATTPIAAGKFGNICVSGATQAIVVVSDSSHRFAAAKDGEEFLQSAVGGPARILWKESGTGTKKAIVAVNGGVIAGDVASGVITAITDPGDDDGAAATQGYAGYMITRHQNVAMDMFAPSGPVIACVNGFELSGELQTQVQDESPGTKSLLRLPIGTLVFDIMKLAMPAELGELWGFMDANAYQVTCP